MLGGSDQLGKQAASKPPPYFRLKIMSSLIISVTAWLSPWLVSTGCLCLRPTASLHPCPRSGFAPGRQQPRFSAVGTTENTIPSGAVGLVLLVLALPSREGAGEGSGLLRPVVLRETPSPEAQPRFDVSSSFVSM